MTENESKIPKAAAEQSENTQSMGAAQAPDTQSEAGDAVQGPEAPRDGEGCEAVTVVIVETCEQYALMAARSVRKNLVGADVLVLRLCVDPQMTLIEALHRLITEGTESERIILMTDQMLLLNPVTIHEIGCRRGVLTEKGVTVGEMRTPKLMYRSVLLRMLPFLKENYPHASVFLEYDDYARPQVIPVIMRPWNQDNWLLPVISAAPDPKLLRQWAQTQRFMYIEQRVWPKAVIEFLEERFPEE